jgi:glycosyltransferase involved in cell wall biosynthesis
MAMALPVVATAVGGTPEVVADGRSGLLVPADDANAMAAAIARLLDDSSFASSLGASARTTVEERYGARNMVRRLEAVYAAVAHPGDHADDAAPVRAVEGLSHP